MSRVFVRGVGAVSPAGWGVQPLREALEKGEPLALKELARPGWTKPLRVRQIPTHSVRHGFMAHPRLRRTSPISHYAVGAALEALGGDAEQVSSMRLGVVLCVMSGCVNYSRRFYDEALRDPATASPLLFPETVFNAPSSHLAALLGATAVNYTLVGDPGTFLVGMALAASWLSNGQADGCLVIGAEEIDWLTADAFRLFTRTIILSEGAGALYMRRDDTASSAVELGAITEACSFCDRASRHRAAQAVREQLPTGGPDDLLCDGLQNISRLDPPEAAAWRNWPGARVSPKTVLGEGLMAAAAWQCVTAVDALSRNRYASSQVSIVGCNQQAIGAHFVNLKFST